MDYQCLFEDDVSQGKNSQNRPSGPGTGAHDELPNETLFYSHYASPASPRLVRLMRFGHRISHLDVQDDILVSDEAVKRLEAPELSEVPGLQFLLSPPRGEARDKMGRLRKYNPAAILPFDPKTLTDVVDTLKFHKVCLRSLLPGQVELGQISRICGPDGLTSIYSETYSYRRRWHNICVSYAPRTMTSSVFVHNLNDGDTRDLVAKLSKPSIRALTIHPMLVPVLVYEFTFNSCHRELYRIFDSCISLYQTLGLNSNTSHAHFRNADVDDRYAAELAFGDGQAICALEERMDFSIMMGKKLMSYFDDLEQKTPDGERKTAFVQAGSIIKNRLEYLVDGLEFQLPRLRRAKAHTQLNRTGLENRTAAQSNRIQYQIAVETRADSTAMKAISLLTMLFLPGTFVSALFAMPLFNWDAESRGDVVSHRFWIYWVVTIPATIAVLLTWRLWWMFEEWRMRKEETGHSWWRDAWAWVMERGSVGLRNGVDSDEDGLEGKGV